MLTLIAYGLAIAPGLPVLLTGGRFLIAPARRQPATASPPHPAAP